MRMLSKSNFINFLQCRKRLWLEKFKPELKEQIDEQTQRLFDQGYAVEAYAEMLFKGGVCAKTDDFFDDERKTRELVKEGHKTIFQPTVYAKAKPGDAKPQLLVRGDIIKFNPKAKAWDIYEVKSGSNIDEEYITDLAFQKIVFESAGYKINKTYLAHINKNYVKNGPIEPKKLILIEDVTADVKEEMKQVRKDIPLALAVLKEKDEVQVKILRQCDDCPFFDYCWKDIPDYSVYDLARTSKSKLEQLLDMGIMKIKDIPDDFPLSKAAELQVLAEKTQKPYIEKENLADAISGLKYPLYFLDYETTFMVAIPLWDGTKPYQQVPFQYSLHVARSPGKKLEHYEFLAKGKDNPVPELLAHLKQDIDTDKGTVIVWNKMFEMGKNKEMAAMYPKYKKFLESVNSRVFDLMEPFMYQYYVDPGFEGDYSLKVVLPILAPELSYDKLEIGNGGTAALSWYKMNFGGLKAAEQKKIYKNLLTYCKLDTYAMVRILEVVREMH